MFLSLKRTFCPSNHNILWLAEVLHFWPIGKECHVFMPASFWLSSPLCYNCVIPAKIFWQHSGNSFLTFFNRSHFAAAHLTLWIQTISKLSSHYLSSTDLLFSGYLIYLRVVAVAAMMSEKWVEGKEEKEGLSPHGVREAEQRGYSK